MDEDIDLSFDAPQHYFDLRNHCEDSSLEAYFDVDHESEQAVATAATAAPPADSSAQGGSAGCALLKDVTNLTHATDESVAKKTTIAKTPAKVGCSSSWKSSKRRSRSHDPSMSRPLPLVLSETPNVLRRGLAQRAAARQAAERAVQQELQQQEADYRRQLLKHRRVATASSSRSRPLAATASSSATVPFKSMAQQVLEFERKTPERFHSGSVASRAAGAGVPPPHHQADQHRLHRTVPRSPQLCTRLRSRSVECLSHEQLQQLEFDRCQQLAQRAQPLRQDILRHVVGVPDKQPRPCTLPKPFHLTAVAAKPQSASDSEDAQPKDRKRSLSGSDVTRGLSVKKRRRSSSSCGRFAPAFAGVDQSRHVAPQHATNTRVKPFSFEERDRQRALLKQQRIEQVLEKERRQREFRAQLMPCGGQRGMPERVSRSCTAAKPFNMPGQKIHEQTVQKLREKWQQERCEQQHARQFRALPCTVTQQTAFQPKLAQRGATVPEPPSLHSENRAQQRRQFDVNQMERQAAEDAQRHKEEQERQLQLQSELKKLRQQTVHRAQPIPSLAPFVPHRSVAPLTEPQTPNLLKRCERRSAQ